MKFILLAGKTIETIKGELLRLLKEFRLIRGSMYYKQFFSHFSEKLIEIRAILCDCNIREETFLNLVKVFTFFSSIEEKLFPLQTEQSSQIIFFSSVYKTPEK